MAKVQAKATGKAKPVSTSKSTVGKSLPPSFYAGQNKKAKPKKDKNGDIIPE